MGTGIVNKMLERQKVLSDQQKTMHKLMFIATIKLMSDQSTYLQAELGQKLKHDFNVMVKMADRLAGDLEKLLDDSTREELQEIVDVLNGELTNLRKQINESL